MLNELEKETEEDYRRKYGIVMPQGMQVLADPELDHLMAKLTSKNLRKEKFNEDKFPSVEVIERDYLCGY